MNRDVRLGFSTTSYNRVKWTDWHDRRVGAHDHDWIMIGSHTWNGAAAYSLDPAVGYWLSLGDVLMQCEGAGIDVAVYGVASSDDPNKRRVFEEQTRSFPYGRGEDEVRDWWRMVQAKFR